MIRVIVIFTYGIIIIVFSIVFLISLKSIYPEWNELFSFILGTSIGSFLIPLLIYFSKRTLNYPEKFNSEINLFYDGITKIQLLYNESIHKEEILSVNSNLHVELLKLSEISFKISKIVTKIIKISEDPDNFNNFFESIVKKLIWYKECIEDISECFLYPKKISIIKNPNISSRDNKEIIKKVLKIRKQIKKIWFNFFCFRDSFTIKNFSDNPEDDKFFIKSLDNYGKYITVNLNCASNIKKADIFLNDSKNLFDNLLNYKKLLEKIPSNFSDTIKSSKNREIRRFYIFTKKLIKKVNFYETEIKNFTKGYVIYNIRPLDKLISFYLLVKGDPNIIWKQ